MAAARHSIGDELEGELIEAARQRVDAVLDLARDLIGQQIDDHREFVAERETAAEHLEHTNEPYGVPVRTGQETDLRFYAPSRIESAGDDRCRRPTSRTLYRRDRRVPRTMPFPGAPASPRSMRITRGLLEVLLEYAAEADPQPFAAGLGTTPAGELTGVGPGPAAEDPVLTHLYLPAAGRSVSDVFGLDLGTPPGRTDGRFVSHPDGRLGVDRSDDLHAVVLVAIPPWDEDSVAAFDRRGRRQPLEMLDAVPPDDELPG